MRTMVRTAVLLMVTATMAAALAGCTEGPPAGTPFGAFDEIWQGVDNPTVWVSGWAIDPDTSAPIDVHVYVDGVLNHTMGSSSLSRPDVGAAYPGYGDQHGWNVPLRNVGGPQNVCVFAINAVGPGDNPVLGCRQIDVSNPLGSVKIDPSYPLGLRVRGWARDLDSADPVTVTITIKGHEPVVVLANAPLPQRNGTMPLEADGRGFDVSIPLPLGRYDVSVVAGNQGPGRDTKLGGYTMDRRAGVPLGELESIDASVPGQFRVTGWAFDPDSPDPINIEISVQGVRTIVRADRPRPELATFFGRPTSAIGFDTVVPTAAGHVRVCAIAKDTADERDDNWLGCNDFIR
jgi:hypothetical protein